MDEPPTSDVSKISYEDLRLRIERQIALETWGRVHDLRVEVGDGGVSVRGTTQSYYIKQLVQQAVFDIVGTSGEIAVKLDIQVGANVPHKLQGGDDLWGVPRT